MSPPSFERLRKVLNPEQMQDFEWMYQLCGNPELAVVLLGYLTMTAGEHLDWAFFEVLHEARMNFKIKGN